MTIKKCILKFLLLVLVLIINFNCTIPAGGSSGGSGNNSGSTSKPDTTNPDGAIVLGVEDGKVYTTGVTIIWTSILGTTSKGEIKKDSGSFLTLANGAYVFSNGTYQLKVTVTKTSNNLTAITVINFTIDTTGPSAPVINGAVNNTLYNHSVIPSWTDAGGTTSSGALQKNIGTATSFNSGTEINSDGVYKLVVTVTKISNGLTASATLNFTIDMTKPSVSISYPANDLYNLSPIAVKVTFSEKVSGFQQSSIVLSNCSISSFATTDNIVFNMNVIPSASGFFTFDVPANICTDQAGNYNNAALQFKAEYFPVTYGKVAAMVYGNDPNVVYAVDNTYSKLYFINVSRQGIYKTENLSIAPRAMVFSNTDNKLYITSTASSSIVIYNLNTSAFESSFTAPASYVQDLSVDPILRRIYLTLPTTTAFYQSKLSILNLDTGATILTPQDIYGWALAVHPGVSIIYTSDIIYNPSCLCRYSYNGGSSLSLSEKLDNPGGTSRMITLKPDGTSVLTPCGGGNVGGSGGAYRLNDFDASNFSNIKGSWLIGTYNSYAKFNPAGTVLFGINGDPYDQNMYVMNATNYSQIRKLAFPNADHYVQLTPNSSGSALVGFSGDIYSSTPDYKFYFFTNVGL